MKRLETQLVDTPLTTQKHVENRKSHSQKQTSVVQWHHEIKNVIKFYLAVLEVANTNEGHTNRQTDELFGV